MNSNRTLNDGEMRRLCCYAVLKSGYSGSNYLYAHMRLVVSLIYRKGYKKIDAQELVDDFYQSFHYYIGFFPMKEILSLAVKKGYIRKERNRRFYHATDRIGEFAQVEADISNSQAELDELIKSFQQFAVAQGADYTIDTARDIVVAYVKAQKLDHITGHIDVAISDKRVDYLFGRFIYSLRDTAPEMLSYLNNIVTGSILSDCLTYHENITNGRQLGGLTVVLDTAIVFIALGVDIANRTEYYRRLISDLQEKGAKTAIYYHTYDEMDFVLSSAEGWICNANYDPSKASDTTEYFRSVNATKDDVEEFRLMLKSNIEKLGIQFIDAHYEARAYNSVEDEKRIYDKIVNKYKETNCAFNEAAQHYTIERDACSIAKTYLLRDSRTPMNLADAGYIFVTANQTLAMAASEYHRETRNPEKSMPSTVTDTFIGTYLWLSDPVKISEMNEKQILYNAFMAFQPNTILLQKLATTINGMLVAGSITPEQCYALKGDKLVLERLAQKTLGDPDAYTDVTFCDIISEIQQEAEIEGALKEKKKNEIIMEERDKANDAIIQQMMASKRELQSDLVHHLNESLRNAKKELEIQQQRLDEVEVSVKRFKKWLSTFIIVCAVVVALATACAIITNEAIYTITSVVVAIAIWTISAISSKELSPRSIYKWAISKWRLRQCKRRHCSDEEKRLLEEKIDTLKADIAKYEDSALSA